MPVALVTGASRGVGKGVATALHHAGYRVFVTGRTIETISPGDLPSGITRIRCDHTNDDDTAAAFARIAEMSPSLDLVVTVPFQTGRHLHPVGPPVLEEPRISIGAAPNGTKPQQRPEEGRKGQAGALRSALYLREFPCSDSRAGGRWSQSKAHKPAK